MRGQVHSRRMASQPVIARPVGPRTTRLLPGRSRCPVTVRAVVLPAPRTTGAVASKWEASTPVPSPSQEPMAPVLLSKLVKAHAARISALVVLKDRSDCKLVVSSSLDKSLATWSIALAPTTSNGQSNGSSNGYTSCHHQVACTRLAAPGGPVFSMVRQPQPPSGSVFTPTADVIYCGNAAKEVVAWEIKATLGIDEPTCDANFQTVATDYTGWVRSLALMGKWLFSCGCNFLVQHDTSFPIPKEVAKEELFKGDIQAIATGLDHVYIASADGIIRSWKVAKKNGALTPAGEALTAHSDRITGLAIHGGTLYSTGFDGCIKAWNADSLAPVAAVPMAHGGEKVHAIVVGSDGLLYTGGDDKLIRSWQPLSPALDFLAALEPVADPHRPQLEELLQPPPMRTDGAVLSSMADGEPHVLLPCLPAAGPPLAGHESSVRVLAAGSTECLISGDSDGDMCVWALAR